MKIAADTLGKFKRLYFDEFGQKLSDAEALDRFTRLTNVLRVICLPDSHKLLDKPEGYDTVRTAN